MKVSVCMITYNHEDFISQALDSVLMQVVDFDYEVVVGEDCSTDNTRGIASDYANRFRDRVQLLPAEKNLGMKHNFIRTLRACRGQYIAMCEGDDYWTSPQKLAKQVSFLENHPEFAVCFHNVQVIYEDRSQEPWNYCPVDQKRISTLEDLLERNFIPSCSVMFRRGLFDGFPDWFYKVAMADWPLHILNAQYGSIGYINEVMGVYRVHQGGAWAAQREDPKLDREATIELYQHVDARLRHRYNRLIERRLCKCYYDLALGYASSGDLAKAKIYAKRYSIRHLSCRHASTRQLLKLFLRLYAPLSYRLARTLRDYVRPIRSS